MPEPMKGARKRKLGTLARADLGKRIAFTCQCKQSCYVEGTLRTFTHGMFSRPKFGDVDRPMVMVTVVNDPPSQVVLPGLMESHWAAPETVARLAPSTGGENDG